MQNLKKNLKRISLFLGIFGSLCTILTTTTTTISIRNENANGFYSGKENIKNASSIASTIFSSALDPFKSLSSFALAQKYVDDKYLKIEQDNYAGEISLLGAKSIVYFGGLFWEDKVAWASNLTVKHQKKVSPYYITSKPKYIEATLKTWTSGLGSPSFEVGGEIKYNGNFRSNLGIKIGIDYGTRELFITKSVQNLPQAKITYAGTGWRYKVTSYGQYGVGAIETEDEFLVFNTENSMITTRRKRKPKTSFPDILGRYIEEKYGHLPEEDDNN